MGRFGFAAALVSLAVGCNVTAQGTITDGMTGEVIAAAMTSPVIPSVIVP